ncbi:MAG: hypothetical protein P1U40_07755 [Coxiellaceae bacterium]|nr:hypothetical protein [Coxiellaceae bacterium]
MRLPQNAPPRKSFQIKRYVVVIIVSIIAILFAIILWFVYPKTHLYKGESQIDSNPDEIGNLYLRHEVNKRPKDLKLRLRLIHQELALGKLKEASKLIKPYLVTNPQSNLSWQFKWYAYQVLFSKATAKPKKSLMALTLGQKPKASKKDKHPKVPISTVKKAMQELQGAPLTTKQLITLSSNAVAIKYYTMTSQIGAKLYATKGKLTTAELAAVAKNSYLSGNFLLAAQFYMAAFQDEKKSKTKKAYYIEAINSLLAGNLLPKQFSLIVNESQQYKNDPEVLMVLAKAALASKKSKLAASWMRQAINLRYITPSGGD